MSKKKNYVGYVVGTPDDALCRETWAEAEALLKEFPGSRTLGGYYTQEDGDRLKANHLTQLREKQAAQIVAKVDSEVALPGKWLDAYAAGFYAKGKYGGGCVIYDDSILLHAKGFRDIPNESKHSGEWAGLLHSIVNAAQWASRKEGIAGVIVHVDRKGPGEWVIGEHETNTEITRAYVKALKQIKRPLSFVYDEPGSLEGFRVAKAIAMAAAG